MSAPRLNGASAGGVSDLSGPIAVYIASPDGVTARVILHALEREGLNVVAAWGPLRDVAGTPAARYDVVVVLEPDGGHPTSSYRAIRAALPAAVIVAVCSPERETPQRLLWAGVDGIAVDPGADAMIGAIVRALLAGYVVVPRTLRAAASPPPLSPRERQLLALVAEGLTNREIAERLFLAESTVKRNLSTTFQRLGVKSRAEAAVVVQAAAGSSAAAPDEPAASELSANTTIPGLR